MIHAQINDWLRLRYKHYQTGEVVQHDFQVSQIVDPEGIQREGEPNLYLWSRESGNMGNEQSMLGIDITGKILMKTILSGIVKINTLSVTDIRQIQLMWIYIRRRICIYISNPRRVR